MLHSEISALYYLLVFNLPKALRGFCSKTAIAEEDGSLSFHSVHNVCGTAISLAIIRLKVKNTRDMLQPSLKTRWSILEEKSGSWLLRKYGYINSSFGLKVCFPLIFLWRKWHVCFLHKNSSKNNLLHNNFLCSFNLSSTFWKYRIMVMISECFSFPKADMWQFVKALFIYEH